ncbi:MAG: bifunctional 4-hydroxy-2-oxoglutarate aldolase/2-dehydro-3-deoxy-phosphogluconate aldolase [Alphaproteobacteria bacterium]
MNIAEIVSLTPVIPVLTIDRAEDAAPLVGALAEGGLGIVEITLRTGAALAAVHAAAAAVPEAVIGVGTALDADDLRRAQDAGAHFAVSPGATPELLRAADEAGMPLLPGAVTASEVMALMEAGHAHAKFFPAEAAGGVAALSAFAGPFPGMRFCATGGVGSQNACYYLELPNVTCVGGSWLAPRDAVAAQDWARITDLARRAAALKQVP